MLSASSSPPSSPPHDPTVPLSHVDLQKHVMKHVQALFEAATTLSVPKSARKGTNRSPSFGANSKLGKSIQKAFLKYIQHLRDHFSQEKGLELLEFLHRLQFDILEPQLTTHVPGSALHTLTATLVSVIKKLFIDVPENLFSSQSWQGVWGHSLKSLLLILNTMFELPSNDPTLAFQTVGALLLQLLQKKDMFYRVQCEGMNCFLQLISRSLENKKWTREHSLPQLLQALASAPSVELQFLIIEAIYRVLPALRHLRRYALAEFSLAEPWKEVFITMDTHNFEKSSRTLVNLINQNKSAATSNTLDYPATVQLTQIVYHENGTKLATPLEDLEIYYLDLTPDALVFTCTFKSQVKETVFDLPYENISKYYCFPHLRQVEFTAIHVPKWSAPQQYNTANFFFQVAEDTSMHTLTHCLHFHCFQRMVLPKISKLASPLAIAHEMTEDDQPSRVLTYFPSTHPKEQEKRETSEEREVRKAKPVLETPTSMKKPISDPRRNQHSPERETTEKGVPSSSPQRKSPTSPSPMVSIPSSKIRESTPPFSPTKKRRRQNAPLSPLPALSVPKVKPLRGSSPKLRMHVPSITARDTPTVPETHAPNVTTTNELVQQQMKRLQDRLKQLEQGPTSRPSVVPPLTTSSPVLPPHAPSLSLSSTMMPQDLETWGKSFGQHLRQRFQHQEQTMSQLQASHQAFESKLLQLHDQSTSQLNTAQRSFENKMLQFQEQSLSQLLATQKAFENTMHQLQDQSLSQLLTSQQSFEKKVFQHLQERFEQVMTSIDMKTRSMEDTVQRELHIVRQLMQDVEHVLEKIIVLVDRTHQDSVRALEVIHGQMTSRPPYSTTS